METRYHWLMYPLRIPGYRTWEHHDYFALHTSSSHDLSMMNLSFVATECYVDKAMRSSDTDLLPKL